MRKVESGIGKKCGKRKVESGIKKKCVMRKAI